MAKFIKKRSKKAGLPPGTLIHIGEKKTEKVKITIIDYDEVHFHEKEAKTIEECLPFKDKSRPTVTWINIDGIHQIETLAKLGECFKIHLTFIAGIYGMNFQYMPEIPWRWGYPAVLLVMAAVSISMVVYFRRKKWL